MKKSLALLMFFVLVPSVAFAFGLEPRFGYWVYGDSEVRAGRTLELRVKAKSAFLSIQRDEVRKYGADFDIDSVGVGLEYNIKEHLKFWVKAAYYMPNYNPNGFGWEGLHYAQVKYWVPPLRYKIFDNYNLTYDNDFGGEIGIDAKARLSKNIDIGITGAWRYLRINEYICGWNNGGAAGVTGWILEQNRDFGGYFIGGLVTVSFLVQEVDNLARWGEGRPVDSFTGIKLAWLEGLKLSWHFREGCDRVASPGQTGGRDERH